MKTTTNKLNHFSIRKYSIGVASVLVGTTLLGTPVLADQVTEADVATQSSYVSDNPVPTETTVVTELKTESSAVVKEQSVDSAISSDKTEEVKLAENPTNDKVTSTSTDKQVEPVFTNNGVDITEKTNSESVDSKVAVKVNTENKATAIDPTNPTGKKTIGYAASNVDKPTTSIVNDVTRVRAIKKDGKYVRSTDVVNTSEGYEAMLATGNGSIARGDDYPQRFKNGRVWVDADDWGQYVKECTSFVAYRLSTVNGFTIPTAYGNGSEWGYRARREGYRVDNNPALGSVAWYDNQYKHVAWVSNVMGDNIEIEEYNWGGDHIYHKQVVNKNTVTGFIHFKDVVGGSSHNTSTSTATTNQGVPESGVYRFTGRASIKSEPKMSSPELAYYDAGQTVNYDRKLTADGHEWISYLSFSGNRRYIPIREVAKPAPTPVASTPTGNITIVNNNFDKGSFDIIISNVSDANGIQKVSLPTWSEVDGQDDIIWYTATRQADGTYRQHVEASDHKNTTGVYNVHLYYVENSGKLVGVGGVTVNVEKHDSTPNIPASGVYRFTGHASIKSEPKMSSPEIAYYDAGNTVNYDKVLTADGHAWISYLSYSGHRRYIAIN